jgi:hypothetical protein
VGAGFQRFRRLVPAVLLVAAMTGSATAATPSISLDLRPRTAVAGTTPITAFGAVATGRSGELVEIEKLECGDYGIWKSAGKVETGNGGTWTAQIGAQTATQFRARWKDGVSNAVPVQVQPFVRVLALPGHVFDVVVVANDFFDRRFAVLERRVRGTWSRVRSFRLKRGSVVYAESPFSTARFRARVGKGTFVRVVVPKSQVGRCYLAGFSAAVRA